MAATTNAQKAFDLALLMEKVQKQKCLYKKSSKKYKDKSINQLLESNLRLVWRKSWSGIGEIQKHKKSVREISEEK